jgi:hypothetical protein
MERPQIKSITTALPIDELITVADELAALAAERDDKDLAAFVTTLGGAIAQVHESAEAIATIVGAPRPGQTLRPLPDFGCSCGGVHHAPFGTSVENCLDQLEGIALTLKRLGDGQHDPNLDALSALVHLAAWDLRRRVAT